MALVSFHIPIEIQKFLHFHWLKKETSDMKRVKCERFSLTDKRSLWKLFSCSEAFFIKFWNQYENIFYLMLREFTTFKVIVLYTFIPPRPLPPPPAPSKRTVAIDFLLIKPMICLFSSKSSLNFASDNKRIWDFPEIIRKLTFSLMISGRIEVN